MQESSLSRQKATSWVQFNLPIYFVNLRLSEMQHFLERNYMYIYFLVEFLHTRRQMERIPLWKKRDKKKKKYYEIQGFLDRMNCGIL